MTSAVRIVRRTAALAVALLLAPQAHAGGPRFVTGTGFAGAPAGQYMAFYTPSPLYFTDPGDLSANVSHAQADAMVAAAANSWNVPTSLLTLAQGGELAEHVSGDNSYFNGTSVVFPADVQATNYLAIQIAVIYDTDGSITDLLLGSGASDPAGCRQNAVTESVDGFGQTGTLEHAVMVLNGRCAGTTPQDLLQMQYEVMRAFGRVIGLAWSQLNDNVFTGNPVANGNQAAYWPVMHPIDVLCGPHSYLCMPDPFTLRPDDLSALSLLYPVTAASLTAGKSLSLTNCASIYGGMFFPTAQGMDMLNITVTRAPFPFPAEDFEIVSGVTGLLWQQDFGNPVTERTVAAANNVGSHAQNDEGIFYAYRIPLTTTDAWSLGAISEPINPLYWGEYAIAPYESFPVEPSGAAFDSWGWFPSAAYWRVVDTSTTAPSTCTSSGGRETAPNPVDSSGWWTDTICGAGHSSWWSASMKAGRSWTLEVTALDEAGASSGKKLRPVMGVWNATDPTGTLPTVAATEVPLNATTLGMTQLFVPATAAAVSQRIAVADLLGQGRPDFATQGRLLYADSLSPATVGSGGGRITISGMGFREGNEVTVNGVNATVISWSATQIVATAPTMAQAGAISGTAVDVTVTDPSTQGQTNMSAVLSYSAALADTIVLVSAPAKLETDIPGTTPFAVRVFASDGVTAVEGAIVQFTVRQGAVTYGACNQGACQVTTDATGLAQTVVTGDAAGTIILSAQELSGGASVQAIVNDTDAVRGAAISGAQYIAAGEPASWSVAAVAVQDGSPAAGASVAWSADTSLTLGASQSTTDATGTATVSVATAGLAVDSQSMVTACAWVSVCASLMEYGVDPGLWTLSVSSGSGQSVTLGNALTPVVLLVTDATGHPLLGAPVNVYQTVTAWEGACPARGRCPAAPVIASSQSVAVSDVHGLLTVTPLTVAGVPQAVNIAASSGTLGFVALSLAIAP